jgi:hypothetical protein
MDIGRIITNLRRTYYVYYWTYSQPIQASIVTSTLTEQTTTVKIQATDSADAQQELSLVTSALPTPASATNLEAFTGETISSGASTPTHPTSSKSSSSTSTSTRSTSIPGVGVGGGASTGTRNEQSLFVSLFGFITGLLALV